MIGFLSGTARGTDLLMVGGVGYLVTVPGGLNDGEHADLHVVTIVREDAFELYGFPDAVDAAVFRLLLKAPGVGARIAIALLGTLGSATVAHAVADGDHATLTRAPGVGTKLAQKMIASLTVPTELLAVLGEAPSAPDAAGEDDPVISALTSLGYTPTEATHAAAAARAACPTDADEAALVRAALRSVA